MDVTGHGSLQVLERTFALLELFTAERPEWRTTELARATDLPVATTHRILATLHAHGYVARDPQTKQFRLGHAAVALGDRARADLALRRIARPVLEWLAHAADETAVLTVVSTTRDASVCLERVESSQPLRLSVEPGRTTPLHAGASQKALLAYLPEPDVERLLARPLAPVCIATIVDPEALRVDLARVRHRGYAYSDEETNAGAWGVAIPLLDADGLPAAAVGLAGPTVRHSHEHLANHLAMLGSAAAEIAAALALSVPTIRTTEEELAWL